MYIRDSFFDSDAVPNTHTHTLEKVTGTRTLVEGMGTSWVRVRVGLKLPTGYPCLTLAPLHRYTVTGTVLQVTGTV